MSRVYLGTLGAGVLQDATGAVQAGQSVTIKNRDGTNATHWSAGSGGSSSTSSITTDANGTVARWVDRGSYTVTVGANTYDFEAGTPVVHVNAYGAIGSGSNESTAIQAAIDDVQALGGGTVLFDAKTYRCNLTAKPNVRLRGEGASKTVLKAVASSNTDVVKGLNFATLTGKTKATGDYALGAYEAEFQDLTIDGDKANQSSGYGIRIWGRAPRFKGTVIIRNCKSGGLWTEFTEVDSFADPVQVLEGHADNLAITACDGHGWTHRGPHDFVVKNAEIWSNTGHAVRVESGATDGTSWNGGVVFRYLNQYLNGDGVLYDGGSFEMHGGQLSVGASDTGLEIATGRGSAKVRGVIVAGNTTGTGIVVRGSGHDIQAQVLRLVTGINLDGCQGCNIDVYGSANTTAITNTSESAPNYISALFDVPGGGALTSGAAFNSGGRYFLKAYGAGSSAAVQQFPSATLSAAGWSPVLPTSNGTLVPGGTASPTYGTTVTPNAQQAIYQRITVTNGTAFTIAAPTNGKTWPLILEILNSSGGAMGAITWNAAYLMQGAFTNPANGKRRLIMFYEVSGSWIEVTRSTADI